MTIEPKMYQHLRAPNDRNGNPKRCYLILAADGAIIDCLDEGYAGCPRWVRDLVQLPTVNVSAGEYRAFMGCAACEVKS